MALDREMLATDLAGVLSDDHGINVDSGDVKRGLDAFLEAIKPTTPAEAAARVARFVAEHDQYRGHRTDEFRDQVARIGEVPLNASDLLVLVRAATADAAPRRPLRDKIAERAAARAATPDGVTPIKCPTCQGPAHLFRGNVQVHLTPGGLPCTGAGQAFQPGVSGE